MSIFRVDFYSKDWLLKTQRLTIEERGVFIQVVAAIYEHQGPIDNDAKWLSNLCNCSVRKIKAVLSSLFDKGFLIEKEGKITQKRAEEELENAQKRRENATKNARNPSESSSKTDRKNAENERVLNEINDLTSASKQSTVNRQQKKDNPNGLSKKVSCPDGVSETVWRDWLQIRQAKKAPVTETALAAIRREAEKLGWSIERALSECCSRGWQGFKAEWVSKDLPQKPNAQGVHWL